MFSYNTTYRLNTATVKWELPKYTDNSMKHDVNHKVTLEEVNNYHSPQKLKIGSHTIKYIVTDKEGLSDYCEFFIKVKGTVMS